MKTERKKFDPGIYDISNDEYHSSAGISKSGIAQFRITPKHYWYRYLNPEAKPFKQTSEMKFGSALHTYIIEQEKFDIQYYVAEKNPHHGSSTAGKKFKAESIEKSEGKIVISQEDFGTIQNMADSIFQDEQAIELIKDAQYEKSIYWIDPDTNLLCKVRPDIMHYNFIVDLKTTADASYRAFQRDFYHYGYHLQLAMMYEAILHTQQREMKNFIDLAIEKKEPYAHAIYPIDETVLEHGIKEFKHYLFAIKECIDSNTWQSYSTQTITLPAYATEDF